MKYIHTTSKKLDKPGGLHIVEPDIAKLKESISLGYSFIAYSVDFRMLHVSCRTGMKFRENF